jgi:porphyrinogen peroxidase
MGVSTAGSARPATPQPLLAPLDAVAVFLVVQIHPGGETATRDLLADVAGLRRSVGFRVPDGQLNCVVGIGSSLYDRIFVGPRPAKLHVLPEFAGERHVAPSTPGDLLFHLRARRMDLCFELAGQLMNRLRGVGRVIDETHGFGYFDERDLLGFVDGTENPEDQAAVDAAIIGAEDLVFAGGSYVIVQKYLHDLEAWNAIPVEEQENAVGRTKLADIELADKVKPANSHVALNTIVDDDGTERQIVRRNMAFAQFGGGPGGTGETGTYFIGYASTPSVTERMLANMFVGNPPGTTDRLLDFSTAVTGTLFFVPSADFLDDLPDAPLALAGDVAVVDSLVESAGPARSDGSLSIGSLRRSSTP